MLKLLWGIGGCFSPAWPDCFFVLGYTKKKSGNQSKLGYFDPTSFEGYTALNLHPSLQYHISSLSLSSVSSKVGILYSAPRHVVPKIFNSPTHTLFLNAVRYILEGLLYLYIMSCLLVCHNDLSLFLFVYDVTTYIS